MKTHMNACRSGLTVGISKGWQLIAPLTVILFLAACGSVPELATHAVPGPTSGGTGSGGVGSGGTVPYAPQPDASSCLTDNEGELVELGGTYRSPVYVNGNREGVRIDARDGEFRASYEGKTHATLHGLNNKTSFCLSGGVYDTGADDDADWEPYFHGSHGVQLYYTPNAVIEGITVLSAGDAVNFKNGTDNWTFRDSYVRHAGDDGVESDRFNNGLIDDVLIDWAYTGFSCREERVAPREVTVTIRDSLIALKPQDGTYGESVRPGGPNRVGHNELFKWTKNSRTGCKLVLQNNVFLLTNSAGYVDPADDPNVNYEVIETAACRGNKNTIIYLGDNASYLWRLEAASPECFDVVTDISVWQEARSGWFDRHPEFEQYRDEEPNGVSG